MNSMNLFAAFSDMPEAYIAEMLAEPLPEAERTPPVSAAQADARQPPVSAAQADARQPEPDEKEEKPAFGIHLRILTFAALAACISLVFGLAKWIDLGRDRPIEQSAGSNSMVHEITADTVTSTTVASTTARTTTETASAATSGAASAAPKQTTAKPAKTTVTETVTEEDNSALPAETNPAPAATVPEAVTTTEAASSGFGAVIDGVFYQKGDFDMNGVIDWDDANAMLLIYLNCVVVLEKLPDELRSEQLALADLLDETGDSIRTEDGLRMLSRNQQQLMNYLIIQASEPSLSLEQYLKLASDEQERLITAALLQVKELPKLDEYSFYGFRTNYGAAWGGTVPVDESDGFFYQGVFYPIGDVNFSGEIDLEDAEIMESAAQEMDSGREETDLLTMEQIWIGSHHFKEPIERGTLFTKYFWEVSWAKRAEVIRNYLGIKEMGYELPKDINEFFVRFQNHEYREIYQEYLKQQKEESS